MHTAYIALGSNLEQPVEQVCRAMGEIAKLPQTQQIRASSLYQTAPVGFADQPAFINAVVKIQTGLTPQALLAALLNIEAEHQRRRLQRNGPRTLDCDILLYGNLYVNDANLHIPHPRLHQRAFVLVPLAEIAPDEMVNGSKVSALLTEFRSTPESAHQTIFKMPEDALNKGISKAFIAS
jgi:2-amino-4-hydroxy-6-hydroxymethyldihydropteridine diphosphokinase